MVFLVDNGARPFSEQHLPRLLPFDSTGKLWQGKGYFWRAAADIANGNSRAAAARIKEAAEEEYRRLLYVGMTRAEDRLIVCGYFGKQQPVAGTWHGLVSAALASAPEAEAFPDPLLPGTRHRYRTVTQQPGFQRASEVGPPAPSAKEAPAWLRQPVPPEPHAAAAADAVARVRVDRRRESTRRRRRGRRCSTPARSRHWRSPEAWPCTGCCRSCPASRRASDWQRRCAISSGSAAPGCRTNAAFAARSVMRVLADPRFAPIFSPDSRAEVGIAGTLEIGGIARAISGKIDRVAVTEKEVLIVDYKTNRPAPWRLEEVPQTYITQLALYRALLQPLYPGHIVSAALLFTEAPLLIAVPAAAMDDALARLTRA